MSVTNDFLNIAAAIALPTLVGFASAALMKVRGWLHMQTTAQDKANMESELTASIGAGLAEVAKVAPLVIQHGITTPQAWQDVLNGATEYFKQRFPDRAALIDASTPDSTTLNAAVQQTIAARLPNVNLQIAPVATPGPVASGTTT